MMTPTGEATAMLPTRDGHGKPIIVIGTQAIRDGMEEHCLEQALNARSSPGVTEVVLGPDAHQGFGAPVGCVMVSPTHIYPGPVGVDVKCSMSLLQLDLPVDQIRDKVVRRALINAICDRIPTGAGHGQRSVPKSRQVSVSDVELAVCEGASSEVCARLGLPAEWTQRCEDSFHRDHNGETAGLHERLAHIKSVGIVRNYDDKMRQMGSCGSGNHFLESEAVEVTEKSSVTEVFGIKHEHVASLLHCGSRGFGNILATNQFKILQQHFEVWSIPLPGGDKELVYAPLGTPEANLYLDDMALAANFSTVNHLLIQALTLEAYQSVFPGVKGTLVYSISHNIARQEIVDGRKVWVHRKGATRAFPRGHFSLKGTPFEATGHPILLPGNPVSGSVIMVAEEEAKKSCYSVNHGAGRRMGRKAADRQLDQKTVDAEFDTADILTNCRQYPKDEAPAAYKDFGEVIRSVEKAGLARTVAKLKACFVIKDSGE
jgi:tRNA-splicing ligase RtcB